MNRLERMFGILLQLYGGKAVTASYLGMRFEVSSRTIYRDVELLSELGVPIYAERGRIGGFKLMDGYYLPPLMFTKGEAVSLLLGLTLLGNLKIKPFSADIELARKKLLASVPGPIKAALQHSEKVIGFESQPRDAFHPEPDVTTLDGPHESHSDSRETETVNTYLQAIFESAAVRMRYRSPYRNQTEEFYVHPLGLFYDRHHWYLVGQNVRAGTRVWRSDRVIEMEEHRVPSTDRPEFDVRQFLDRKWLNSAMNQWQERAPVKIRVTPEQAEKLMQDWYYAHAKYDQMDDGTVVITYGEDNVSLAMELLRWLGPGAELLEPREWRQIAYDELKSMLNVYEEP
ncbi:YafY family transcriptional regulator [Alicyclobacillus curvatus]|jgi:predicted DNA-binding transcriptional regulator YafY|nr:YafY family transcriptional regulator [Alicyclobacillus curvatus]